MAILIWVTLKLWILISKFRPTVVDIIMVLRIKIDHSIEAHHDTHFMHLYYVSTYNIIIKTKLRTRNFHVSVN